MEDKFDRIKQMVTGTPGYQRRVSTITDPGTSLIAQASWIVETVRNDEGWMLFLQSVSAEGGQRIVLPAKVIAAIFRHERSIIAKSRKEGGRKAYQTRQHKAVAEAERIVKPT